METIKHWTAKQAREAIRQKQWTKQTSGIATGFTQANLVVLPEKYAFDFLLFCFRNPKACPVLDVTEVGSSIPYKIAPQGDIKTDIPKYCVYEYGKFTEETDDISHLWSSDSVGFLIGCSFTFEHALLENNIPVRQIEENKNVPMFQTTIACEKAGIFEGPLVVSMRPIPEKNVVRAVQITTNFPSVHGAPVHIGDPASIGITDINQPDYGDAVTVKEGEVPVFWACGVTPQAVAKQTKPEMMITHAPGHMFITDQKDTEYSIL